MQSAHDIDALLVRLSISTPGNIAQDDDITREIKTLHSLTGDVGEWKGKRLESADMTLCASARYAVESRNKKLTLRFVPQDLPTVVRAEHGRPLVLG